jgi:hypothetical protein
MHKVTPSGGTWKTARMLLNEADGPPICSAKGCREPATRAVVWNNPKVHTPDREKVWHACEEHVDGLRSYLDVRSFYRRTDLLDAPKPG